MTFGPVHRILAKPRIAALFQRNRFHWRIDALARIRVVHKHFDFETEQFYLTHWTSYVQPYFYLHNSPQRDVWMKNFSALRGSHSLSASLNSVRTATFDTDKSLISRNSRFYRHNLHLLCTNYFHLTSTLITYLVFMCMCVFFLFL